MFSQVFLLGRIATMPDDGSFLTENKESLIHVCIQRPFNDLSETQQEDLVPVVLWWALASRINEICHVGSFIAVRGRILNDDFHTVHRGLHTIYVKAETIEILDEDLKREFLNP